MTHGKSRSAMSVLVTLIVSLAVVPAVSVADELKPENFDVKGADMMPVLKENTPSCRAGLDGTARCTLLLDSDQAPKASEKGYAKDRSTGEEGDFYITCSTVQSGTATYDTSDEAGAVPHEIVDVSGKRYQACSWQMDFTESGSSIIGTVEGDYTLSASICGTQPAIAASADVKVHVITGTGRYADMTGDSTLATSDRPFSVELLGGGKECGMDGSQNSGDPQPQQATASATSDESQPWQLKLRKGKLKPRVLVPSRFDASQSVALRVVSAPGSQCQASAGQRSLGSATDKSGRGEARFSGSLGKKLGSGTWKLKISCTAKIGGKSKTAKASKTVKIS